MKFTNLVKGQITQGLLSTLLERAGYRVTRFGIEELFAEVKLLEEDAYKALELPDQLRTLPDLLVADRAVEKAFLVEVKYRRRLDSQTLRSLYSTVRWQRQFWPQSYVVLMRSDAGEESLRFHQDYIRVLPPDLTDVLNLSGQLLADGSAGWASVFRHALEREDHDAERAWNTAIWQTLPLLSRVFTEFDPEDHVNADRITQTLKDLRKL